MSKTCIQNVRLYTGKQRIEDAAILTDGARFLYAGAAKNCPPHEGARVIDGKHGIAMPGFYNAHTHAAMSLLRGVGSDLALMDWLGQMGPYEAKFDGDAVYWGTQLAMMEMIRRGVVAFADMYFHMDRVAQAANESGMRAVLCRGCSDEQGVNSLVQLHQDWNGRGDGRIRIQMGLHAEYTSTPNLVRYAVDNAQRFDTGFHTHISETAREHADCITRHGVTPARYFYDLGALNEGTIAAHCVHLTDEDIELMRISGASAAHNPASNMKLASGFAPVQRMLDQGINVCLGTDGAASNNMYDMFAEMRLAALIAKGHSGDPTALNGKDAIHMATRAGAKAMGFQDAGLIQSGMLADLILLDGEAENLLPGHDPIADIVFAAQGLNVRLTMVNGRILYQDGAFTTIDEQQVRTKFMEHAKLLSII
ncbi:amidohydrolase [Eubacteriales bacterium OttesenSCG-928-N13]|nr:amidohydrolase [Eubacteriales bacterium OttesenSCG-928-N13]